MTVDNNDQVTVLVGSVLAYLASRFWSWLQARQGDKLVAMERWARKAVDAAILAFPDLTPEQLANRAASELRSTLGSLGFKPSDPQWAHLTEVVGEAILAWQLSRLGPAAAKVAAALPPATVPR